MKNTKPRRKITTKADANELLASLSHWVNETVGASFDYVTDQSNEHTQLNLFLKVTVDTEPEIGAKLHSALELIDETVTAEADGPVDTVAEEPISPPSKVAKDLDILYNEALDAMLLYMRNARPKLSWTRIDMAGIFNNQHMFNK